MRPETDEDIAAAMRDCVDEPAHIPGHIQSAGCMLAYALDNGTIQMASANVDAFIGSSAEKVMGRHMRDVLSSQIWHAMNNAVMGAQVSGGRQYVGELDGASGPVSFSVVPSGDFGIVEIEPNDDVAFSSNRFMQEFQLLLQKTQNCTNIPDLLESIAKLMRFLTGYDRVMVYKFDPEFNGEIVAEARRKSTDSFLGLKFPHWDIPAQAREIMTKLPVRVIHDVDTVNVPLISADPALPPLDMTQAHLRGVSPVHTAYLRNMNVGGTMTLTLMVSGALWGMVSFHHGSPKTPSTQVRRLLEGVQPVLDSKIAYLQQEALSDLTRRVEDLEYKIQSDIGEQRDLVDMFPSLSAVFLNVMASDGIALFDRTEPTTAGLVPDADVMATLYDMAVENGADVMTIDNLPKTLPAYADSLSGCAGVIIGLFGDKRAIMVFRRQASQDIKWAGNPEKTIDRNDGRLRLRPRGSFSAYLETVEGRCMPWTDQDRRFASRLWSLVNAAERKVLMNTLTRHQELMINELNHRVRNILALVRSVSRQSQRNYGSLNSYTRSLESRIQALAIAHDISSGTERSSVLLMDIIKRELAPYLDDQKNIVTIDGEDAHIVAQSAPILGLVVHELTTNAVKYGALSTSDGHLAVDIQREPEGVLISWIETGVDIGGDNIRPGFGTTLIREAVPYEMGGDSQLEFTPNGLKARLRLSDSILWQGSNTPEHVGIYTTETEDPYLTVEGPSFAGFAMVLEDNYLIASEMAEQLRRMGFDTIEIVSGIDAANDLLDSGDVPVVAVLDINLGTNITSEPVALRLQEMGIPFLFATGYDENVRLDPKLKDVQRLLKPISIVALQRELKEMLG